MSDPYNSHGSSVPPITPYTPAAPPRADVDLIARLEVADSWKRKFRLIEKAGGPGLPNLKDLPFGERFGINFNLLGLIFGPFYYLAKGLWRQAVLYFILAVAIALLLEAMGLGRLARGVGAGLAAVCAFRANTSYYKRVVLNDAPWL